MEKQKSRHPFNQVTGKPTAWMDIHQGKSFFKVFPRQNEIAGIPGIPGNQNSRLKVFQINGKTAFWTSIQLVKKFEFLPLPEATRNRWADMEFQETRLQVKSFPDKWKNILPDGHPSSYSAALGFFAFPNKINHSKKDAPENQQSTLKSFKKTGEKLIQQTIFPVSCLHEYPTELH